MSTCDFNSLYGTGTHSPGLTWRDVQYLIAYTSDRTKLVGGDWITNGAGLVASIQFGFGAIDAEALVSRAKDWITVPHQGLTTVSETRRSAINSDKE